MRVALFSPFNTGPLRGNLITVQRIARHLPPTGWEVVTIPLDSSDYPLCERLMRQRQPDLLHAFHAFHTGPLVRTLALQQQRPYLITMTGSDLYDPALSAQAPTQQALADAAAIVCFDPLSAAQLTAIAPRCANRVTVIPQGVTPLPVQQPLVRPAGSFIVLLPAALRPVKGVLEALQTLTPLAAELPRLNLWLAGGDLDPGYAQHVRHYAAERPWVTLLGEVPHQLMGAVYAASNLVLNTSQFEGGMANTLLEAMAAARPVIARDVAGNCSLIRHGETGWLFNGEQDLLALIRQLAANPEACAAAGQAARGYVAAHCSPVQEGAALAGLYQRILNRQRT